MTKLSLKAKFDRLKSPTLVGLFAFLLLVLRQPSLRSESVDNHISPPPMLEKFSFGFNEVVADSLWIRVIQDFDYCEQKKENKNCQGEGWLFKMLDTIANLAPTFRKPLATGPLALTVIISDIEGASKLFDKAVTLFPNDWSILYRASYHAIYEEKNNVKAANLLYRAAKLGAPSWLYSLSARLYTESGQRELAELLLKDLENSSVEEEILERIKAKLAEKARPSTF